MFHEKGITIIGISYDPVEVLKSFADEHGISYHLLSDVYSKTIKTYGILNTEVAPHHKHFGIPNPGLYVIDENRIVIDKQFERSYAERPTAENVLVSYFDHSTANIRHKFETPYLTGSIAVTDTIAYRAQIIAVIVDITMQDSYHVYGKPVPDGYVPFSVSLKDDSDFQLDEVQYPEMQRLLLQDLNEAFLILPKKFTLQTSLRVPKRPVAGKQMITIKLSFQACDDKVCFIPEELDFEFPLTISK